MTGSAKLSSENCARNFNSTKRTSSTCTTQHLSWRMTHTNSSGILTSNGSLNLGQTTRPYNNQQKKSTYKIVDFAVPADHRVKLKEIEKKDKYLDLTREVEKTVGAFGIVTKRINKGTGKLGNKRTSGNHPNYCIIEISVTKTPVKDQQLILV